MVTLIYLLVFLALMLLSTAFNAFIMKQTFWESLTYIYLIEMGTKRMIVVVGSIIGIISAIWIDVNNRKKHKNEVQNESK
ncbi:hypothetical protein [Bacillus sp. JCM 19034]|uniref:hypothetical protein n=1 Tax=Bacillus sp. JCM 19034 TaxID=1481928 RepID=UPI000783A19C|nr:hypothetical protein [Bacillus sp. JCM 19034]